VVFEMPPMSDVIRTRSVSECHDPDVAETAHAAPTINMCTISTKLFGNSSEINIEKKSRL
jgi:hypothetical protein